MLLKNLVGQNGQTDSLSGQKQTKDSSGDLHSASEKRDVSSFIFTIATK